MKIIQYIHRPNNTELGKGNTHETYMLIGADIDLTTLFPIGVEVSVKDSKKDVTYPLMSSSGSEFRVNKMGPIYRDYSMCEGDEVWITKVFGDSDETPINIEIKTYNRVLMTVSSGGATFGDLERLSSFGDKDKGYNIPLTCNGKSSVLDVSFKESKKKRSDSPIDTDFYSVVFDGEAVKNGTYLIDISTSELLPYKKCIYNEVNIDLSDLLQSSLATPIRTSTPTDYDVYFRALRTKPFLLLAGISGTGKSRIVRELAFRSCPEKLQDVEGTTPGNYLMIEVKPNWHDSSELLGYYSNISKSYHFTKFIDFLVLAHNNKEVPFFVCLDEMNLAPVEQYFAEFLSVLETRRYPKTDTAHIKSGALVDKKHMDTYGDGWPTGEDLTLPDNVFIIGTVNMDDTTHQFSRKVIDRAMTIEMNGGDLESMFGNSNNLSYTNDWTLADFKPKYVQADEVLAVHGSNPIKEDAPAKLEAINACLEGTPFEVSYRVLNELCVYIGVLLDSGVEYNKALDQAVDQITLMKILPRIEGDEDMFRIPKEEKNRLDKLRTLFNEDTETYKKLGEMISRLDNGFTRFWP